MQTRSKLAVTSIPSLAVCGVVIQSLLLSKLIESGLTPLFIQFVGIEALCLIIWSVPYFLTKRKDVLWIPIGALFMIAFDLFVEFLIYSVRGTFSVHAESYRETGVAMLVIVIVTGIVCFFLDWKWPQYVRYRTHWSLYLGASLIGSAALTGVMLLALRFGVTRFGNFLTILLLVIMILHTVFLLQEWKLLIYFGLGLLARCGIQFFLVVVRQGEVFSWDLLREELWIFGIGGSLVFLIAWFYSRREVEPRPRIPALILNCPHCLAPVRQGARTCISCGKAIIQEIDKN